MRGPRAVLAFVASATAVFLTSFTIVVQTLGGPTEAPTGFDNQTNGFIPQAEFDEALATFAEQETIADGLGPVYNAQSCGECHQNPVTGSSSQISELRAGHLSNGNFVDAPGGSLINDRAINAAIQELVPGAENIRALRMSLSVLGDGFVEAINSNTLLAIANAQPNQSGGQIAGQLIQVPVPGGPRQRARRAVRLEEPAREPDLVLGRRVPERDGNHEPVAAERKHVARPLRDPV